MREIDLLKVEAHRLRIDSRASIVTSSHAAKEQEDGLRARIGSTASGTGAALLERLARSPEHIRARDISALRPYIEDDTTAYMRKLLDNDQRVLIEGTQGFGLSIWHSNDFPFATSRDTTAAGFVSEAGLAPHDVDDVVMVLRTFPIRVGGNSGPLPNEITWPELSAEAHLSPDFKEYTTATHRVRRVARFDRELVRRAIAANRPHRIVLNHMDYVDPDGQGRSGYEFLNWVESEIGQRVDFLGYGADCLVPRESFFVNRRASNGD
jgi:adenylosuccinate synthase